MFSFLLFTALSFVAFVVGSSEYGGGGGGGGGGGYGGVGGGAAGSGGYGYGGGGGGHGNTIEAAIKSERSVSTHPVDSGTSGGRNGQTPVVDINTRPASVTLRFNSYSSNINAIQKHIPRPGIVKKSEHKDEADIFIMKITKPIVQKVREVIQPIRQQTTEIQPVREKVQTIIASSNEGGNRGGKEANRGGEHYPRKGQGESYGENSGGGGETYADRGTSEGAYASSSSADGYVKEASDRKETHKESVTLAKGKAH